MKQTDIIIIGPLPNPVHGMSLANENLYRMLLEDGKTVKFIKSNAENTLKDKKYQGRFSFYSFYHALKVLFFSIISLFQYRDAVIYVTPGQSVLGLLRYSLLVIVSYLANRKIIFHFHGSKLLDNIQNSNLLCRLLCRLIVNLVTINIFLSETIAEKHKKIINHNKISICNNGVQSEQKIYKPKANPLKILFLSNLMKDKGFFDFVDALEILNEKEINLQVDIAGAIESSYEKEIIERLDRDYINFHSIVQGPYKKELLNNAHVLCLPSYDEGQPLVILEAYMSGCAVITTDVGGIHDIFYDSKNGYYCQVNNPVSIVEAVFKVYRCDFDVISSYNFKEAKEKYSLEVFYSNLRSIIFC